jgi:hypothetical protein
MEALQLYVLQGPQAQPGDILRCDITLRNTGDIPFKPKVRVTLGRDTAWGWNPATTDDYMDMWDDLELAVGAEKTWSAVMQLKSSGLGEGWHTAIVTLYNKDTNEVLAAVPDDYAVYIVLTAAGQVASTTWVVV